ncbi:hypothetical protein GQ457_08G017810 [Hibiscus cannabinus]
MSPQLMYNPVLSPSVEWSGHLDNCVYPEDSSDTHVTTRLIYNESCLPRWSGVDTLTIASTLKTTAARMSPHLIYNSVLSPSVEWSGHLDNCVYPEDSGGTHVTTRLIYAKSCLPRWSGVDTPTIASTLKTAAARMSP